MFECFSTILYDMHFRNCREGRLVSGGGGWKVPMLPLLYPLNLVIVVLCSYKSTCMKVPSIPIQTEYFSTSCLRFQFLV